LKSQNQFQTLTVLGAEQGLLDSPLAIGTRLLEIGNDFFNLSMKWLGIFLFPSSTHTG